MITDSLKNLERYLGYHKHLDTAIRFLLTCDFTKLPDGKTIIDGDHVFINVMEADLRQAEDAAFEYHKKYADLQIDLNGSEYWEYALFAESETDFSAETDFGAVSAEACCTGVLGDGRFVLFFPNEFHKPSCINGECRHVRKAVVKIELPA